MALTDLKVRSIAAPKKGVTKVFDSGGLYIQVDSAGRKYWRYQYYRPSDKTKRDVLALGVYPEVSLREARLKRDAARALVFEGIDPKEADRQKKQDTTRQKKQRFHVSAWEWYNNRVNSGRWGEKQQIKIKGWLNNHILPAIGDLYIDKITPQEVLQIAKQLEADSKTSTANTILGVLRRIFQYGITMQRCTYNPAYGLNDEIAKHKSKNRPHFTDEERLGKLLNDIDGYSGSPEVIALIKLSPYVFARPGEVRSMRWSEIDFDNALWEKSAEDMKMSVAHVIPLPKQAIDIINSLKMFTGNREYVFYNPKSKTYLSENAASQALNKLGYKGEFSPHGWRHTASTILHEKDFNTAWIEIQLAHKDKNQIRGTYNHAKYLDQRRIMMQQWADYLDRLREEHKGG